MLLSLKKKGEKMEYIVVILISIISLIVLKFAFGIKIKDINKIKKIGNDK